MSGKIEFLKIGDRGFEVEWCTEIPVHPGTTDADVDNAKYSRRTVRTLAKALKLAKEVYPLDKWGCVTVTEMEWKDEYDTGRPGWEYVADSLHYSGEGDFDEVKREPAGA